MGNGAKRRRTVDGEGDAALPQPPPCICINQRVPWMSSAVPMSMSLPAA